jgi:hypothetical protein
VEILVVVEVELVVLVQMHLLCLHQELVDQEQM